MKFKLMSSLFVGLLATLFTTNAWGDNKHYYYAAAKAVCGTGCAKVYASASNVDGSYSNKLLEKESSTPNNTTAKNEKGGGTGTFYLYAQHKYGYKFSKWVVTGTDKNGTSAIEGDNTEIGCKVTVKEPTVTQAPSSDTTVTGTFTANYVACTDDDISGNGNITFETAEGLSLYSVSEPIGFPAVAIDKSYPFYNNDVGTFFKVSASGAVGYKLVKWHVTRGGGEPTVVSTSSTGDATMGTDGSLSFKVNENEAVSIKPEFKSGAFQVGTELVETWQEALDSGEKAITLVAKYTVGGDMVIPEGYTLSFDNANLTLTVNGKLTVNGTLNNTGAVNVSGDVAIWGTLTNSKAFTPTGSILVAGTLTNNNGGTVTIAEEKTLSFANYDAKVVNNGEIVGKGSIAMGEISITQDEAVTKAGYYVDENGEEQEWSQALSNDTHYISATFGIKYNKDTRLTKTLAGKISGKDPTVKSQWSVLINGKETGVKTLSSALAKAFVCKVDDVSMNHVIEILKSYDSVNSAVEEVNVSNKEIVIITEDETICTYNVPDKNGKKNLAKNVIIDCAGNDNFAVTPGTQVNNGIKVQLINGGKNISVQKVTNATAVFINCKKGTTMLNAGQNYYTSTAMFYDCGDASVSYDGSTYKAGMTENESGKLRTTYYGGVYVFSGGNYPSLSLHAGCYLYGGNYTKDPKNCSLAALPLAKANVEIYGPNNDIYTVGMQTHPRKIKLTIGQMTMEKDTIAAAILAAGAQSAIITVPEDLTIDEPLMIKNGQNITLALSGYSLESSGTIIDNKGNLIIDGLGVPASGLKNTNGTDGADPIIRNEDGATLNIAYGNYSGKIQIDGGTFITHAGTFDTELTVAEGANVQIRGGLFANKEFTYGGETKDLVLLCPDGYKAQSSGNRFYMAPDFKSDAITIVKTPNGEISDRPCEMVYSFEFLNANDRALYIKGKGRSEHNSIDDWYRRAELSMTVEPFVFGNVECILSFDRDIAEKSICAYGSVSKFSGFVQGGEIAHEVKARGDNPKRITGKNGVSYGHSKDYPDQYYYYVLYESATLQSFVNFLSDAGGGATFGIKRTDVNDLSLIGTTCRLEMVFCTRRSQSGILTSVETLRTEEFQFTGKGAIWNGIDYDSLAAALDAANYSGTIKLSKDCEEEVEIKHLCEFTIDYNNFDASKLTFKLGNGLALKVENGVYTVGYADYTITYKDGESVLALSPTSYTMNDEVALPTITKERNAFLGWKIGGEGEYLNKIAKGTIGNLTLTAYWKDIEDTEPVEMEIAKGTSDSGEAAEFKVEVAPEVVQKAAKSGKSVVEVLNDKESNGLAKWEAMAIEEAKKAGDGSFSTVIETKSEASANTVEVTLNSEIDNVKSIGLAKVAENSAGAKIAVENVQKQTIDSGTTTKLTVDFALLDTGVYQPTVFVEKDNVTVEIPDPNAKAVTVIKTESTEESVMVAVPGDLAVDGKDISVDKVIDVSSLEEGDTIQAYNGKSYEVWEYNGEGGWTKPTVVGGTSGTVELKAGSAFWLTRGEKSDKSKPIVVVAAKGDEAEKPTSAVGDGWNMMANPTTETVKISEISSDVAKEGDTIVVPTKGLAQKTYTYKDGKWGYTKYGSKTVKIGDKEYKVATAERVEVGDDDDKIESGKGLWYVTEKANGKAINWSK